MKPAALAFLAALIVALPIALPLALPLSGDARAAGPLPDHEITAASPALAREVHRSLAKAAPMLFRLTGRAPRHIVIKVYSSQAGFQEAASQMGGPPWAAGLALPRRGLIILRSPRLLADPGSFGLVVTHELTHLYLHAAAGAANIPLWLEEGIAMYASAEGGWGRSFEMGAAVLTGRLIPLGEITRRFPAQRQKAALAYAQSYYLVSHLVSNYGDQAMPAILRELGRGRTLTAALDLVIGKSLSSLEMEFKDSMSSRFSWLAIIFSAGVLWALISILAGVALVFSPRAQLRQRRRAAPGPAPGKPARPLQLPKARPRPPRPRAPVLAAAGLAKKAPGPKK